VQFTRPAVEAAALADEAVTRARRFRLDVLPHILVGAAGAHFPLDPGIGDRLLREALELRPGDDDLAITAWYGRGLHALYDGRYDAAAAHWQRCVEDMRAHPGGTPNDAPAGLPLRPPVAIAAAARNRRVSKRRRTVQRTRQAARAGQARSVQASGDGTAAAGAAWGRCHPAGGHDAVGPDWLR
jgi:hypothetical protein